MQQRQDKPPPKLNEDMLKVYNKYIDSLHENVQGSNNIYDYNRESDGVDGVNGIDDNKICEDDSDDEDKKSDTSNVSEAIKDFWEAYSESDDDENMDSSSDIENYITIDIDNASPKFTKLSFENIKNKINENFDMPLVYNYSAALDILASYVKCHINIYLEASYHCTFKLNIFMMPCIFLSAACSVLSSFINSHKYVPIIIACVNGIIAFLLAIINYLKLDACSEAHKISSYL